MSLSLPQALESLQRGTINQGEVKSCLGVVEGNAKESGLLPQHLQLLAEFIASRNANSSILTRAVRCLVPRISVPCSSVLRLLGSLKGHPLSLQLLIIRWAVLVYDILDDSTSLHGVYGIIFHYLQFDELRPAVCQLLCYLTRRCDVSHSRIQKLMEISKRVENQRGSEGPLLALLVLYHSFCPHMLTNPQRNLKKTWFKPFEKQLASNIKRLQKVRWLEAGGREHTATEEQLHKQLTTAPPPLKKAKRRKYGVIARPDVVSLTAGQREKRGFIQFEAINSHHQLCNSITRIEFPSQMARVLDSRHLQHMFSTCPEPSVVLRFTYWLEHNLGCELDGYTPGCVNTDLQSLLNDLLTLTQFLQEPIPRVESFLHILLEVWNGDDYRNEIFGLLSHLSLQPFADFEFEFLEPLKRLFISKDRDFKCHCLQCYTQLLINMAVFEWPRRRHHGQRNSSQEEAEESATQRLSLFSPAFDEEIEDFDPLNTISLFLQHVDQLIIFALEKEKQNPVVYHAAMKFYEVVADLPMAYGVHHLFLAPPYVLNTGLLGQSSHYLSLACRHLVKVKENLSAVTKNRRGLKLTQTFNSIILDFCNALWRNMIFKKGSSESNEYPTLAFTLTRQELLQVYPISQPQKRLNLVHHPALVGFALQFLRETQEKESLEQMAPSAIWQETRFKKIYLQFLNQNHLSGISDFIHAFVHTN